MWFVCVTLTEDYRGYAGVSVLSTPFVVFLHTFTGKVLCFFKLGWELISEVEEPTVDGELVLDQSVIRRWSIPDAMKHILVKPSLHIVPFPPGNKCKGDNPCPPFVNSKSFVRFFPLLHPIHFYLLSSDSS